MPEWTKEQLNAINARGCNILVSAAAGSGKTAVLVERVIKLITDESLDVDISDLLVVTFTNAAAAEMKERISKSLAALLSKEPNNTNALKQLSLLPSAKICTIDSFCINLVREYFFRLDIAQDFTVLDESRKEIIEQTVIDEIMEELYEKDDESFKSLVEMLSTTKSDKELVNAVKRLDNYITAQPFPIDWLNEACELYNPDVDIDGSPIKDYVLSELKSALNYIFSVIDYSVSVLDETDEMFDKYSEMLSADRNEFINIQNSLDCSWDELREKLMNMSFIRTPSKRGYESSIKTVVLDNRKIYNGSKSIINTDILPLFAADSAEIKADNEYLYPIFRKLIELVNEYHIRCFEVKKELNSYSFSDIEHLAIELLFGKDENGEIVRTDIAEEYERNFKEILVDEYQDTNSAQDTLFEMLSNGKNRFMVGDVKQSIYRFRLAMPHIFNSKKDSFTPYDKDSNSQSQKIILDKNFRSVKGVCEYVNFLFSSLMSKQVGELDYNSEEYLNYNPNLPELPQPSVQLKLVETPDDEHTDEYEAKQIARYIVNSVNNGDAVRDGDSTRAVKYGDFAVLLRSTKNRIDVFCKVFSEYGIPVIANNRTNLFDNNEVSILLSLLRVIDNPTLDIPLLATLMSVFYGYTADDIAKARIKNKTNNLFTAVSADSERFSAFLKDLDRYRRYAASMSVEGLIRQIIGDTSYISVISAMGNYEQRRSNLQKLISLAKSFDSGESVGLTAFIRYVDSIIDNNISLESADVSGFDNNCVKLMSVHKSKGLEFPVCILAGTAHKYNNDDLKALILFNNNMGVGLKVTNEKGLYRYNSIQYSCIKNLNAVASMSENLRVLYVAITRAKDRFVAFASYPDIESKLNSLSKKAVACKLMPNVVKKAQCDADLLVMTALIHPDGSKLRKLCEGDLQYLTNEQSCIDVEMLGGLATAASQESEKCEYSEELLMEIKNKLDFTYARKELAGYASKRTASSLDEAEHSFKFFAKKVPSFILSGELSGAEKGTAMHTFMQYCNYENSLNDLDGEIKSLCNNGYLTQRQADALNRNKLNSLFNSDFAKRMFNADKLYRELKVSSFVELSELENSDYNDKVLVQGIADCVFEENGELVLVDYKTDYVTSEDELLELYKKQIAFYKYAVEKTLNMKVKETMLYSFCLEKCCVYK